MTMRRRVAKCLERQGSQVGAVTGWKLVRRHPMILEFMQSLATLNMHVEMLWETLLTTKRAVTVVWPAAVHLMKQIFITSHATVTMPATKSLELPTFILTAVTVFMHAMLHLIFSQFMTLKASMMMRIVLIWLSVMVLFILYQMKRIGWS